MTTLMKATGSADFLGMVPALVGYTPTQSLVLLPFEGNRTYGAVRIDLPEDPCIDLDAFTEQAVALVSRVQGADAFAVVVYCGETALPTGDGLVLPHSPLVDHLLGTLEEAGFGIVDALCATPEGWSSYLDDSPQLLALPERRFDGAEAPEPGDQHDGAAAPQVDLAEKERVGRALLAVNDVIERSRTDRPSDDRTDPQAIAAVSLLDDMTGFAEQLLLRGEVPTPFETAAMLWMLERPVLRDAVLVQWATDIGTGDEAFARQLSFHRDGTPPAPGHSRMLMGEGPRPDMHRLHLARRLARDLAARAPRAQRPGPLAIAAWASWAVGRATHAVQHLDEIRGIDPQYSFANLLGALFQARPLPDWLFQSRAQDVV